MFIDKSADFRVYNHPNLMHYYKSYGIRNNEDLVLFNGGSLPKNKNITYDMRSHFNLDINKTIIVFTGSASSWHNIDDLISLQKEFDINNDDIQIIIGGGKIAHRSDIINISPLDEKGCENLILCADACILPVNDNRVSPGSPLKLYQYLLAGKPVITQENTIGYSDEVIKYNAGLITNFKKPKETRYKIVNFIKNDMRKINSYLMQNRYKMCITWDDRMLELEKVISSHSKFN
jgi:glycosyltransferase involved in cell wall biosynthesis